jgi:hypothetical protein
LLKIALLLGVEVHFNVVYKDLVEPNNFNGWRTILEPRAHRVSNYDFDVIVLADGRHEILPGFQFSQTHLEPSLCISASFVNHYSDEETDAREISSFEPGFDIDLLVKLYEETGISLKNVVYSKNDTHYFILEATKDSLLGRGVVVKVLDF